MTRHFEYSANNTLANRTVIEEEEVDEVKRPESSYRFNGDRVTSGHSFSHELDFDFAELYQIAVL